MPLTECVICNRTLGHETRDLELPVCHEHRKCGRCSQDVLSAKEVEYCLSNKLAIHHARCLSLQTPNLDMNIELLNLSRLIVNPNPLISRTSNQTTVKTAFSQMVHLLSHEQLLLIGDQAQALAAACSLALGKNRREMEQNIEERDAARYEKAKSAAAGNNLTIADKIAVKAKKAAESADEKAIQTWMALPGMTREVAMEQVKKLKAMRKEMLND